MFPPGTQSSGKSMCIASHLFLFGKIKARADRIRGLPGPESQVYSLLFAADGMADIHLGNSGFLGLGVPVSTGIDVGNRDGLHDRRN